MVVVSCGCSTSATLSPWDVFKPTTMARLLSIFQSAQWLSLWAICYCYCTKPSLAPQQRSPQPRGQLISNVEASKQLRLLKRIRLSSLPEMLPQNGMSELHSVVSLRSAWRPTRIPTGQSDGTVSGSSVSALILTNFRFSMIQLPGSKEACNVARGMMDERKRN